MSSEYKAAIYRDKSLSLEQRLKELEGGLAWAANDAAADLVREALESIMSGTIRYAFEYKNGNTGRRWARTGFDRLGKPDISMPSWAEAMMYIRERVNEWIDGTELRVVEITTSERFSEPVVQDRQTGTLLAKKSGGPDV